MSPDGRFVAFTTDARNPGDPRLAVVDVVSGRMLSVGGLNRALTPPAWSPDSRRIAVAGGPVVTLEPTTGGHIRSIGVAGEAVAWSRGGDLFIISGSSARSVLGVSLMKRVRLHQH